MKRRRRRRIGIN